MRRIAVVICMIGLLVSCGPGKVVQEAASTMKGNWRLTNISYPENRNVKVTLLDNIPSSCLEGSSWNFISNNNTGSYTPAGTTCPAGPNFFVWSINEMNAAAGNYDLMYKPTNADYKSTTGNQGYRLNLVNLSADQMVWEQTVSFEGKPFTIRMNFNKIQ